MQGHWEYSKRHKSMVLVIPRNEQIIEYDENGEIARDVHGNIKYRNDDGSPFVAYGTAKIDQGCFRYTIFSFALIFVTTPFLIIIWLLFFMKKYDDFDDFWFKVIDWCDPHLRKLFYKICGAYYVPSKKDPDHDRYWKDWEEWKVENRRREILGRKKKSQRFAEMGMDAKWQEEFELERLENYINIGAYNMAMSKAEHAKTEEEKKKFYKMSDEYRAGKRKAPESIVKSEIERIRKWKIGDVRYNEMEKQRIEKLCKLTEARNKRQKKGTK